MTLSHQDRCRGTLQNLCKMCVERCNVRLSAVHEMQQWLPISQRMTVGTDVLLSFVAVNAVQCQQQNRSTKRPNHTNFPKKYVSILPSSVLSLTQRIKWLALRTPSVYRSGRDR